MKKRTSKKKKKDAVEKAVGQSKEQETDIAIEIFGCQLLSNFHLHIHLQEKVIDAIHNFDDDIADVVLYGSTIQKN